MYFPDLPTGMSERNPFTAAFEMQRRTLEGSQRALEQSIEFQRRFNEAMMQGMTGGGAGERTVEVTREAMDRYLDTIEATVPGAEAGVDQIREAMDRQFEAVEQAREEATDLAEESMAEYEELSETYLESVDDQLDTLFDAQAEIERQTEEFLDRTETQLQEMREEADGTVSERIEQLQERTEQLRERMEPN
jgi:F0F1-type ATP synthase membrane subunit b/b'